MATTTSETNVSLVEIESAAKNVQECFTQCLYEVPGFQRPYSWGKDQLIDFWEDAVLAEGDFFLGSTVTWVDERRKLFRDTYAIIDGQQRLTTCVIALSVIRDLFQDISDQENLDESVAKTAKSQAVVTQKYILAKDDDEEEHVILNRPEQMFYDKIQNPQVVPSNAKWDGSAKNIGLARSFFEEKLLGYVSNLDGLEQVNSIKKLRGNILKAQLIQVEMASEEDGFLVFETLNTRGKELLLADLIKNLIIRGGSVDKKGRENIVLRWKRIVEQIEHNRTASDAVDRFIWQSWNSRRAGVKEPELYKKLNKLVAGKPEKHLDYLKELETDVEFYKLLDLEDLRVEKNGSSKRDPFSIPEVVDSVRALALFNVSVANSAILSAARKYSENRYMTTKQLKHIVRMIENFHFQFNALTTSSSTGGTRARYNNFAVDLEDAADVQSVQRAIDNLRLKLKGSLPARAKAESAFSDLIYAPSVRIPATMKLRSRQPFISYVLYRFAVEEKVYNPGLVWENLSIEHILPQDSSDGKRSHEAFSVGNLLMIPSSLNIVLGNQSLDKKLELLSNKGVFLDSDVTSWRQDGKATLTRRDIEKRAESMAKRAMREIWAIR